MMTKPLQIWTVNGNKYLSQKILTVLAKSAIDV